jgi:hypothetical protein
VKVKIAKNEGAADRIARTLITLGIFALGAFFLQGTAQIVAVIMGTIMTITTALGFCPLYHVFGINTCGKHS